MTCRNASYKNRPSTYALLLEQCTEQSRLLSCQVKPEDSVASLKETLEGVSGIPVQQQLLIHNGKELASRCVGCSFFF